MALASSLVTVQVVAGGVAPAGAATGREEITLAPFEDVADGQAITVTGSGFEPDVQVAFVECDYVGEVPDDFSYCDFPGGGAVADGTGAFTGTITPVRSFTAPSSGVDVLCFQGCTIVAIVQEGANYHMAASANFLFAPPVVTPPTLSFRQVGGAEDAMEGNSGLRPLRLVVSLEPPATQTVTVHWTTKFTPGAPTPRQADPTTDFVPANGTLTFAPGERSKEIQIDVKGDREVEDSETIIVYFTNPTNAVLSGHYGLLVITEDDGLVYGGGASTVEGDAGTVKVWVPVWVTAPTSEPLTVHWRATSVSNRPPFADPVDDFVVASGTATIPLGLNFSWAVITVKGDTRVEPDEWIVVAFSNPSNGKMFGGYHGLGFGVILNDD